MPCSRCCCAAVLTVEVALQVFLSAFYFNNAASIQRSDYTRYMILTYVTLFRLNEMGHKRFRFLLLSQDATKVHHFLSFLFNLHNIKVWLKDEWCKYIDRTYLENEIIGGVIEKNMEWVNSYLAERYERAFGTEAAAGGSVTGGAGSAAAPGSVEAGGEGGATATMGATGTTRRRGKPPTKPKAPRLTAPKPRLAPEPIRIEQTAAAKPVPNVIDRKSLAQIEEESAKRREETRKAVAEKYAIPANQPFKLHETRSNVDAVREEVDRERYADCTFGDGFRAKPAPKYPKHGADVKLNVAAVLREDALYKKKQEADAMLVKAYEEDLRDSTTFYQWQSEMREKDEAARKAAIERRRLEMVASQKEAVEAAERARQENRIVAKAMKLEKAAYQEQLKAEEEAHLEAVSALVEEVREVRESKPREAKAMVFASKVAAREELNEELAAARARKAREDQAEQERKDDLIRQIRALERVPKQRVTVFDPTQSSGVGLLEEMSLVELKERLEMNVAREAEAEGEKRAAILREKREKEAALRKRIANMSRVRDAASSANRTARARRKQAEAAKEEELKEERAQGNLKLAERLAAKRAARAAEEAELRAEEARIAKKRMFLGAAKAAIEERHFEEQMVGAEREAKERQEAAKREAASYEEIKKTRVVLRKKVKRAEVSEQKAKDEARRRQLEEARGVAAEREMAEIRRKKKVVLEERTRHEATLKARDEMNLYAATMTQKVKEEGIQTLKQRKLAATRRKRSTMGRAGATAVSGGRGDSKEDEWSAFG